MDQPTATLPWPLTAYVLPVLVTLTAAGVTSMIALICRLMNHAMKQLNEMSERQANQVEAISNRHLEYVEKESNRNRDEHERSEARWLATLEQVVDGMRGQTQAIRDLDRTVAANAQATEALAESLRDVKEDMRRVARP